MTLTRTFHPIGQGAFYTEEHIIGDDVFRIVYDCGSKSKIDKSIITNFSSNPLSTKAPKPIIDILFISHFHADHINKINILKDHFDIKKVILPLIHEDAKILIKINNNISGQTKRELKVLDKLIDNPTDYFGKKTTVITVKETEKNVDPNAVTRNIKEINETSIDSGTIITSGINNHDWLFIPFNYKHSDNKDLFIEMLKKRGLNFQKLRTIEEITKNKKPIKDAYEEVDSDLNINSMILFSGKETSDKIYSYIDDRSVPFPQVDRIESGCIYFGDINLTEKGDIKLTQESEIVADIKKKLNLLLKNVGTIQIPHHGSKKGFNSSILSKDNNIRCAIFSFGTNNFHGHPFGKVICAILSDDIIPYFVTEKDNSKVIQTQDEWILHNDEPILHIKIHLMTQKFVAIEK